MRENKVIRGMSEPLGQTPELYNNGLQLTRSARSALRRTNWGQSLRAALAAEAECSTGARWELRGSLRVRCFS
jgi:hypothetical protein